MELALGGGAWFYGTNRGQDAQHQETRITALQSTLLKRCSDKESATSADQILWDRCGRTQEVDSTY